MMRKIFVIAYEALALFFALLVIWLIVCGLIPDAVQSVPDSPGAYSAQQYNVDE